MYSDQSVICSIVPIYILFIYALSRFSIHFGEFMCNVAPYSEWIDVTYVYLVIHVSQTI